MITVLGASGFIGSNIVQFLKTNKLDCFVPERNYEFSVNENLGDVIYCIGLTADFRIKPFETIEAHVCKLKELLELNNFQSLLYLSSTRVYQYSQNTSEIEELRVNPSKPDDLYNISKIMGESACLAIDNSKIRVARISNVIGMDFNSSNFISSLLKDGISKGIIDLNSGLNSSKDYIMIDEVVNIIMAIVQRGNQRMYNIASGVNVSNKEILNVVGENVNCKINKNSEAKDFSFPKINIERIKNEFGYSPQNILLQLPEIINKFKSQK